MRRHSRKLSAESSILLTTFVSSPCCNASWSCGTLASQTWPSASEPQPERDGTSPDASIGIAEVIDCCNLAARYPFAVLVGKYLQLELRTVCAALGSQPVNAMQAVVAHPGADLLFMQQELALRGCTDLGPRAVANIRPVQTPSSVPQSLGYLRVC